MVNNLNFGYREVVNSFQNRGPMTEKALLPSDDLTYGMDRTSESEDRVETECDEMKDYCKDMKVVSVLYVRRQSL